jgi:hypothetical protein
MMTDPTFSKTSTRPASGDPFPPPAVTEGAWDTIRTGHELIWLGRDRVLDWEPETGGYRIWNYDRSVTSGDPFPGDPVTEGAWGTIRTGHELISLGMFLDVPAKVLDWEPATGGYRIWDYDASVTSGGDPFPGDPVTEGAWGTIRTGHELIFLGNVAGGTLNNVPDGTTDVLDWVLAVGVYRIWRYYWQ